MHDFAKPEKATSTRVSAGIGDSRLPGRPTPKFVYAHHPSAWEHDPDLGYLPRLTKIPLKPGINGCKRGPNGHQSVIARLHSEGWIVIDESGPVKLSNEAGEIVDDTGYLYKWEGRKGPIYQDCWAQPSVTGAGPTASVDWSAQYDRAGFAAFRAMLRDLGTIPAPQPSVLAHVVKVQRRRATRRIGESHDGNPHIQKHVKVQLDRLEQMETEATKLGVKPRKKTKRGPGRPKKVAT